MNQSLFRKRVARIITSPEEVLYAITSHWVILTICIAIGTLAMWKREVDGRRIYEGRAQLLVNPLDTFVVHDPPPHPQGRSGDEIQRFLISQTNILQSDSVLQKLVELRGPVGPEADETQLDLLQEWKEKLTQFFYENQRPAQGPESESQSAIIGFRQRSQVKPDLSGNTIKLFVYGTEREFIKNELTCWINAYIKHIDEISRENLESYLPERIQDYKKMEAAALKDLEAFKKENPGVSSSALDLFSQNIMRLQVDRDDLRRQNALGPPTVPPTPPAAPDADAVLIAKWKQEINELLAKKFDENSDPVQQIRKKIALLEANKAEGPEPKKSGGDEDQKFEIKYQKICKDLDEQVNRSVVMKGKLQLLQDLEENHKRWKDKRMGYEQMTQDNKDIRESRKSVQIQVADKPMVSAEPFEYYPLRRLLQGFVAGTAVGLMLALLIEISRSKVRFANDIVNDVGLAVVAVVRKR